MLLWLWSFLLVSLLVLLFLLLFIATVITDRSITKILVLCSGLQVDTGMDP